jgi:amino acid adenylation domain-containing protein
MSGTCSYEQLDRASTHLAARLLQCGVGPEVLVGLSMPRGMGLMVGALGILKAGGAYVALDPTYPPRRLAEMIDDAALRVVVCSRATAAVAGAAHAVLLDDDVATSAPAEGTFKAVRNLKARNLAYAVYTSGSTGRPKASLLEHRGLVNLAHEQSALFDVSARSRVLQFASISFDAATFEWVMALAHGAQLCLPDEQTVKSPAALSRFIVERQITHATLPPVMLGTLDPGAWRSVTTLIVAGEACSRELAERWCAGRKFFNAYGPSEMTVWSTTGEFRPGQQTIHIGRPIGNTHCLVLDESRAPVRSGESGELYIAGVGISRGYLRRPELTAERFVVNPYSPALSALMFRSGDRVRELPDGNLEFLGRIDRQVKVRGFRVEPEEIERALAQHPAVTAVAVEPQAWQGSTRLVAYVSVDAIAASMTRVESEFDQTYRGAGSAFDDFTGWNSSFTGARIPQPAMLDWRDATVARIRSLQPRRVLEVGCGAGLLLAPLIAHCERYTATDISTAIIGRLERDLHLLGDHARKVVCIAGAAHELETLASQRFDTIVVNSVIQYFPDGAFLRDTLARLVGLLGEGGRMFVGDVRNLHWNEQFHAAVLRFQGLDGETFEERLRERLSNERELVIAPEFFLSTVRGLPGVDFVEVLPKLGRTDNEMNAFRYDAVIHRGVAAPCASVRPATLEWASIQPDFARQVHAQLAGHEALIIRDLPNARISQDRLASDPAEWLDLAQARGCQVEFALGTGANHDRFHVLLRRGDAHRGLTQALYEETIDATGTLCNDPRRDRDRNIEPALREHLRERLPSYMEPAQFVLLPALPMTPNGKIDRRALTSSNAGPVLEDDPSLTATQRELRVMWQRLLGTQRVGIHDRFFRLGGDSLGIVGMAADIHEKFDLNIDYSALQGFTLALLAEHIELQIAQRAATAGRRMRDPETQISREVFRL